MGLFSHSWELLIVLGIAVIVLGPKRLPEAGKGLGKAIRGFREETQGLRHDISAVTDSTKGIRDEVAGVRNSVHSAVTEAVMGTPASSASAEIVSPSPPAQTAPADNAGGAQAAVTPEPESDPAD